MKPPFFLPIGPDVRPTEPAPVAESEQARAGTRWSRLPIGVRSPAPTNSGAVKLPLPRAEAPGQASLQYKPDQMPADDTSDVT
jgi:hypothetical protein